MKRTQLISFLAILFVFLFGCNEGPEKPKRPDVFLSQTEMEKLLIEIHLADAIAQEKSNGSLSMEKTLSEQGFYQILQNYRLNKKDFDSLYVYYIRQPELMNEMYNNIIEVLSRKQAELAL